MEDDVIEEMTEKKVRYHIMWTAADTPDMKKGKIYTVVAEWYDPSGRLDSLSVIDESGEDYIYFIEDCKRID